MMIMVQTVSEERVDEAGGCTSYLSKTQWLVIIMIYTV